MQSWTSTVGDAELIVVTPGASSCKDAAAAADTAVDADHLTIAIRSIDAIVDVAVRPHLHGLRHDSLGMPTDDRLRPASFARRPR